MSGAQCDDDEPLPLEADHANAEWASEDLQKLQFLLAELTPSDLAEPSACQQSETDRAHGLAGNPSSPPPAESDLYAPLRVVGGESRVKWATDEIQLLKSWFETPAETETAQQQFEHGLQHAATHDAGSHDQGQQVDHEQALSTHGFTVTQIFSLNNRPGVLKFLAAHCASLQQMLPSLYRSDIVKIGLGDDGEVKLNTLFDVLRRSTLKSAPLSFTDGQMAKIARLDHAALLAIESVGPDLVESHRLSPEQVAAVAGNAHGGLLLHEVHRLLNECQGNALALSRDQVLAVALRRDGLNDLQTLLEVGPKLLAAPHLLGLDQITGIASRGGARALIAVERFSPTLRGRFYNLTSAQVCAMASQPQGDKATSAFITRMKRLLVTPYHLTREQVFAIACKPSGGRALKTVFDRFMTLRVAPVSFSTEQIVALAIDAKGDRVLRAAEQILTLVAEKHPNLNWTAAVVMRVAAQPSGADRLGQMARFLKSQENLSANFITERLVA